MNRPVLNDGRDDIEHFLTLLFGEKREKHLISVGTFYDGGGASFAFFKNLKEAAAEARKLSSRSNVYFGCGLLKDRPKNGGRGKADQVSAIPGLWAEVDYSDPVHKKSDTLPPDRDAALVFIEKFPLKPTLVIDSGHGFHCYWLFKELWEFENKEERDKASRLAKGFENALAEVVYPYTLDRVSDLTRVLRVPGTHNRKREPHVPVRILCDDGPRYNPGDFQTYTLPEESQSKREAPKCSVVSEDVDLSELIVKLETFDPKFKETWEHKREDFPSGDYSTSNHDMALATTCVQYGLSSERVAEVLRAFRQRHGANAHKADRQDYVEKTIEKARQAAVGSRQLTDVGNALMLVDMNLERLIYIVEEDQFYVWNGQLWKSDKNNEVRRLAMAVPNAIRGRARDADEESVAKALRKWAKASENLSRIKAMVELARSDTRIHVCASKLDASPYLLGVKNGALNLKTGLLSRPRLGDYITRGIGIDYDPKAECPVWYEYLKSTFDDQDEMISYVQRCVGYTLTGETSEEVLFLALGGGANGKSTFVNTVASLLGSFAKRTSIGAFTANDQSSSKPSYELAGLAGARMAITSEMSVSQSLDEALIKQVTGRDAISACHKYGAYFSYQPQFKVWIMANSYPSIAGSGTVAIRRRIMLIPFDVTFREEARDKNLRDKLHKELPGILAWAVEGCLQWRKQGLNPPKRAREVVDDLEPEVSPVDRFVRECCDTGASLTFPTGDLHEQYVQWCKQAKITPLSVPQFGRELAGMGYGPKNGTGGKRLRKGLRLRQDGSKKQVESP